MGQHPQPLHWRKSSASAQSNCVEVAAAADSDSVYVRNTRERNGAVLHFTRSEWEAFLTGADAGEFSITRLQHA